MECDRNGDYEGRIQKTLKSGYNQRRFHKQLENGNHKGFIQKEIEIFTQIRGRDTDLISNFRNGKL